MHKQQFETDHTPHLSIRRCPAAITVIGWRQQTVLVEGDGVTAVSTVDAIELDCAGDVQIMMPINGRLTINSTAAITIRHLHGEIKISSCRQLTMNDVGQVQAEEVDGGLTVENGNGRIVINHIAKAVSLRRIEAVQIKQADSNLSIQFATGFVNLGQVKGTVTLNSINGDVTLVHANGDTDIKNIGGLTKIRTSGKLTLHGTFAHGEQRFISKGDMVLDWPDAPLSPLTLLATAVSIQNDLPLSDMAEETIDGSVKLNGHIEHGKPFLILKTNGRLHLKDSTAPITLNKKTSAPPPVSPPLPHTPPPASHYPPPNPETRRHILQLLKDDLLSINQVELLLAALTDDK